MVSFDRTLSRLETTAARKAIDDPEALQAIFTRRDLIEQAFARAYSEPDPFVALVELWYDAYRLSAWNRNHDEESSILGKGGAPQRILDRIRNIARRWIQPNIFDALDQRIRNRADSDEKTQPLIDDEKRELAPTPALVDRNDSNGIIGVLGLPLAPFTASESLSRTAAEVGQEARRIADRIDRLPIDLGTELDLVILEILSSPQVTDLLDEVDRFNNEFERITAEVLEFEGLIDELPTRIREETTILIDELESRSEHLVGVNDSIRETIVSGGETLERLTEASRSLGELAIQVEETGMNLDATFGFSARNPGEPDTVSNPIIEIRNAANAINETAISLRELVESPQLKDLVDQAGQSADQTLNNAINRLVWRLCILLLLAFLLGGLLVWFTRWLRRSET